MKIKTIRVDADYLLSTYTQAIWLSHLENSTDKRPKIFSYLSSELHNNYDIYVSKRNIKLLENKDFDIEVKITITNIRERKE